MFDGFFASVTLQGLIENLVYPIAVVIVGAWIALLIDEKFKANRLFQTVLEGLRREMRFAKEIHPLNQYAAAHLTGAFVNYPVTIAQRLMFDTNLIDKVADPFLSALQAYLHEALLINSMIENSKLVISAGLNPGGGGAAEPVTIHIRKKLVEAPKMEDLINGVEKTIPYPLTWYKKLVRKRHKDKQL